MTYGAKQYKKTNILTASRTQILLMLYEGAIRAVKKAIVAIENKDISGKAAGIGKAHDIIMELAGSLDLKAGGDIAQDLERLYNFMIERLVKANLENDVESLKAIEEILVNLHSGWKEAIEKLTKGDSEAANGSADSSQKQK